MAAVHRCETALIGAGLRLLDTTTKSGGLEGLTILGSGSRASPGLRLPDIVLEDAILVT